MHQVTGVWKNFTFKFIQDQDEEKVLEHLRENFCADETLSRLAGEEEDSFEDYKKFYQWALADAENLGLMALDNDTEEVVAVRIAMIQTKKMRFHDFDMRNPKAKILLRVMLLDDERLCPFETFGIDYLANFVAVTIDSKYRNQGVLTELYARFLTLLQVQNIPMARSTFISPCQRIASQDFYFTHVSKILFKDLRGEDGKAVFSGAWGSDQVRIGWLLL